MADMEKLVEQLSGLTVLEAAELVKMLEEKWGVSAAAPVAVAAGPAVAAAAEPEEEKTEFDVVLKDAGPKKIEVIKVIRAL
ncbi:MAG TPA: 50S ribosomal protein L7/L12, partial [Anaerolineaceae bacterium]|nr:50S ribosomal protein L7/L12 [Anaerolineaceae bacterium]HPD63662.1 50S ribosomal protein L7/L12 [Anaerolineaceae bacterium]